MTASAFISHSWADKPLARQLANALKSYGVRVWLDEAEIKLGDSLISKIRDAIDQLDYVIAIISEKSCRSEWVSKELDIAMNEEIEGKRVKVLPILATKCNIPGFLKGKLYADMTTKAKFQKSLLMLLSRLDVDYIPIDKASSDRMFRHKSNASWMSDLEHSFDSKDTQKLYQVLCSIELDRWGNLLRSESIFNRLAQSAGSSYPPHIRLKSLEVLGHAVDNNFSCYIEPFLGDSDMNIVQATIRALQSAESTTASGKVLEILRTTEHAYVKSACLEYFAKVEIASYAQKLSFMAICRNISEKLAHDPGFDWLIAKAITNQLDLFTDELFLYLADQLKSGSEISRRAILEGIEEKRYLHLVGSPLVIDVIGNSIIDCLSSVDPRIKAYALLCLLKIEDIHEHVGYKHFFDAIRVADKLTLEILSGQIIPYNLDVIFGTQLLHEPTCVSTIKEMFGASGPELDSFLEYMLIDIAHPSCIEILADRRVAITGAKRFAIIKTLLTMGEWKAEFSSILQQVDNSFSYGDVSRLIYLIACEKAGTMSASDVIGYLPKKLEYIHFVSQDDRTFAIDCLKELREKLTPADRRKLIKALTGYGLAV